MADGQVGWGRVYAATSNAQRLLDQSRRSMAITVGMITRSRADIVEAHALLDGGTEPDVTRPDDREAADKR